MMLELQRPFPVKTVIGYGWAIIVSRESGLANDIWTVAMERDGALCHFRSDQIFALPNGTLDIATTKENSGTIAFKSEPHNHTTKQHDQIQNRRKKNSKAASLRGGEGHLPVRGLHGKQERAK